MLSFHITLHARPPGTAAGPTVLWQDQPLAIVVVPQEERGYPFPVTFESVCAALSEFPRLFIEPDGAFVWTSDRDDSPWQVDGVLYDRDGRLLYVELHGTCPAEAFDRFLGALGCPQTPILVQIIRAAAFVELDEFRRVSADR